MIILILGKPGSGKGTQAKTLAERYGMYYFATGDFSRELAKRDERIAKIVSSGGLIPENEMTSYISSFLEQKIKETKDVIFDGYPRYVSQYQFLEEWLRARDLAIDLIVLIEVSDEELVKRLSARRVDPATGEIYNLETNLPPASVDKSKLKQREDDRPGVIRRRLAEYAKNVGPMLEFIAGQGKLARVNGERPIEAIQSELVGLVESLKK